MHHNAHLLLSGRPSSTRSPRKSVTSNSNRQGSTRKTKVIRLSDLEETFIRNQTQELHEMQSPQLEIFEDDTYDEHGKTLNETEDYFDKLATALEQPKAVSSYGPAGNIINNNTESPFD